MFSVGRRDHGFAFAPWPPGWKEAAHPPHSSAPQRDSLIRVHRCSSVASLIRVHPCPSVATIGSMTPRLLTGALITVALITTAASGSNRNTPVTDSARPAVAAPTAPPDRKYLLERVDDAAVVQLYADGFSSLPLDQKRLIWHLYQAALAGRDIYYDQRYAHNLEMRDILEEIITHPSGVDPQTLAEIQRYTKLFWLNTGPFNNLTARKFVLKCTAGGVRDRREDRCQGRREVSIAERRDPRRAARQAAAEVLRPRRRPSRHQQDAGPGERPPDREREQPLRRRVDERPRRLPGTVSAEFAPGERRQPGGALVEEVYRVGGRYDKEITSDRRPPRGGDPVRDTDDGHRAAGARSSSTRPARRPTAWPTTSPGSRTRPRRSTRSTASSRSTWTLEA